MNNQKRTLSPASIVSMVGAMIFAVVAACMIFVPSITVKDIPSSQEEHMGLFLSPFSSGAQTNSGYDMCGNSSVMDISIIGKSGKNFMDNKKDVEEYLDSMEKLSSANSSAKEKLDEFRKALSNNNLQVIFATVAFFGVLASAAFVCLGKALQSTGGGRTLATIFALIGLVCSGGYLIFTIVNMNQLDSFFANNITKGYKEHVSIGAGPIIMTAGSLISLIFCCIGNGEGAFRYASAPVNNSYNPNTPYNAMNNVNNMNGFNQPPVQPQQPYNNYNPGGYAQPQNPSPFAPVPQITPQNSPLAGDSTLPLSQINKGTGYSGDSTLPLSQINKGTGYSGDSTLPLSQINKGTGYSGDSTLPLSQINKGTGYSGDSTLPLSQINKGTGYSGESTVSLDHIKRQSGEATVPLSHVRSMSGEGTIPLSQVGAVPVRKAPGTLKCVKGDFTSLSVDLKPNEKIIIGRDPAMCSVIVGADKSDVSRSHCSVWYDPVKDAFKIKDTSSNGTFVNGQKLPKDQHVQIPDGAVISLGSGDNQFKIVRN